VGTNEEGDGLGCGGNASAEKTSDWACWTGYMRSDILLACEAVLESEVCEVLDGHSAVVLIRERKRLDTGHNRHAGRIRKGS